MTILLGDFNAKAGRKIFSNQQSATIVHMKLATIMELGAVSYNSYPHNRLHSM
jgi:hypothetical protein